MDEETMRIAAIMALITHLGEAGGEADIGRHTGEAWSIDHRRMGTSQSPLLSWSAARSVRR